MCIRDRPKRVGAWMERLEHEGIRGADLVFACIGPALEIFSRYSKVETAEGREVGLPEFLEKVWEEIGRAALKQILGTDAPGDFGEDARLTALFLWTVRQSNHERNGNGRREDVPAASQDETDETEAEEDEDERPARRVTAGYSLPYDIVRRFAQPLGIHLDKWEGRLIEIEKGVVRLLAVSDRADQLVERGVAHDLGLIETGRRARSDRQLRLFETTEAERATQDAAQARTRVAQRTWSQLHLDSISTLDHVHKAMLLQRQGRTNALRELLFYEKHYRPEFVRLANSLSALYPPGSEEKRLLDAMILAIPR